MADSNLSPDMQLPVPAVGVAPGPEWASLLNECLSRIDSHDHTPGQGVKITPSGLNISANLSLNGNNLTLVRAVQLAPQTVLLSDTSALYTQGVDLYYNDLSGNRIRVTQNGSVAGTPGSISNLIAPASASFVALSGAFVWQAAASVSADMDFGSAIMRNDTLNSHSMTLSPPLAMGADSQITLPVVPGITSSLLMDSTGAILTQDTRQSFLPPGVVQDYAGTTVPSGWLPCDGTYYVRASYPALFAAIGVTFGSTNSTNFAVPNLVGLVTAGAGGALGALSATGGEYTHVLTVPELPSHNHSATDSGHSHFVGTLNTGGSANGSGILGANGQNSGANTAIATANVSIGSTGSNAGHNNVQPFMALNKIIKI